MRVPIRSPWATSKWANPTSHAAVRAEVQAFLYPSGVITDGMHVVIEDYQQQLEDYPPVIAPPTGCSRVDLYVNELPGGRVGTPHFAWLLHPTIPWTGVNLLWNDGTLDYSDPWSTHYCVPGCSVILAALANGWRVCVNDSVYSGYNPGSTGNPVASYLTFDGSLQAFPRSPSQYYRLDRDGGPPWHRQLVDDQLRAMNQMTTDYGAATKWCVSGHCGGNGLWPSVLSVDVRPTRVAISRLFPPIWSQDESNGGAFPEVMYWQGPVPIVDYCGLAVSSIAHNGHKTIITAGLLDPGQPIPNIRKWDTWWSSMEELLAPLGSQLSHYLNTTPDNHQMDAAEVSAMMAVLES